MKVLLLSDAGSIHTVRWANALSQRGIDVRIFSYSTYNPEDYASRIKVYSANYGTKTIFEKAKYLQLRNKLKALITDFKPDILHAHYASSYGLLGRLSRFQPFIISVWGTDIYEFPRKNFLFKQLLKHTLSSAQRILSTSSAMAKETRRYVEKGKPIDVTPFGINLDEFQKRRIVSNKASVIVGTIKTLERNYGVDLLILAFNEVRKRHPDRELGLVVGGDGSEKNRLISLCKKLEMEDSVAFLGKIEHSKVPEVLNEIDIFVALSYSESFGVAVIEASACEIPTVVSNVGGLPEVVENNVTGFVVPVGDYKKAADAIEKLLLDQELRKKMGKAAKLKVYRHYDWNQNVQQMIDIYNQVVAPLTFNQ